MEPFTTAALATALTTLVNSAAGEVGKTAWTSLTGFLRTRSGRDTAPGTALATLEEAPGDRQNAVRLATLLTELANTDEAAAAWLNPWFEQVRAATVTTAGPAVNIISGQARVHGPVIQGQTFNGPIHF
jgi:hypothetical protein